MISVLNYAKEKQVDVLEVLNYCKRLGIAFDDENYLLTKEEVIKLEDIYKINKAKVKFQAISDVVYYEEGMTVSDFAKALGVNSSELIKKLFSLGIIIMVNNNIGFDDAEFLCLEYNKELKQKELERINDFGKYESVDKEEDLVKRPPIVTIMGHVDHGKTTLLDVIRKTNVVSGEAGGITQAIGAYQVEKCGGLITFIDTPGHEAFTAMRARGAEVTDIVIIVVAADDGLMPQTKEAIDHALAANVNIVVAINKIDKLSANPDKVMTELAEYGLMPDTWGGDTLYCQVSALRGDGIDELLENIILIADMQEYKANPNRLASGTVIEAKLDKHLGSVVSLIVQNGTLKKSDYIVVGNTYGKIRVLKNELKENIKEAYPSQPVFITGLSEVPVAGDKFMVFKTEKEAKQVALERKRKQEKGGYEPKASVTFDDVFSKINDDLKEINIIIKADTNGSAEALRYTLEKIEVANVRLKIIRCTVGGITENDVLLGQAANAIIVGFNVRPLKEIKNLANESGVNICLYNVIYDAVLEIESIMKGMLEPIYKENVIGSVEVRQLFKFSKVGIIAGSYVVDGLIKSNSSVRIIRGGVVIYTGKVGSLRREKDSVREVKKGFECGITVDDYNDLKVGDIIEVYEMVEVKD